MKFAAKEIIKRDNIIYYPKDCQDLMIAVVEIAQLNCRLATPATYFSGEPDSELETYSADGILFASLVHVVRIEQDLFAWGWLPEQVRALGLAIYPGEGLAWPITREFVTIEERDGSRRPFYRLC